MLFNTKTFKTAFSAVVAVVAFSSAPAFANSAASADIAAPLRAAEAAKAGVSADRGDDEFRRLFASWQQLDNGILPSAKPVTAKRTGVSIPSLVPVAMTRLSSGYGMRNHPVLGGRRAHKGIDLSAPTGTPIRATADGTVEMADWFGGYGLYVQLDHGAAMETRYGHMSRIAVAAGQQVRKGDIIGYVGSTGRSTGPHLHYEVRVSGEAVNPLPYMQGKSEQLYASNATDHAGIGGPEE
ncbi:M23 family metallopeptidase [Novosphingobium sp. ERN07]|uniref:M23 family metallopeptidase n=1 Tax=Novosphingobium sp. ERN07 TaxID=2726187 RepID=UPI0014575916|nr:M23 family metallopeptidase [Novosphingobium sp. ERN07]NLR69345.1 M23 family metallopeptidase [Novosphingobium sp. ERN07]